MQFVHYFHSPKLAKTMIQWAGMEEREKMELMYEYWSSHNNSRGDICIRWRGISTISFMQELIARNCQLQATAVETSRFSLLFSNRTARNGVLAYSVLFSMAPNYLPIIFLVIEWYKKEENSVWWWIVARRMFHFLFPSSRTVFSLPLRNSISACNWLPASLT